MKIRIWIGLCLLVVAVLSVWFLEPSSDHLGQPERVIAADRSGTVEEGPAGDTQPFGMTEDVPGRSALSAPVRVLTGRDGRTHNYPSLLKALDELGDVLSEADIGSLMELLDFPNDRFPEKVRPIEINAVKNDVLDLLLRQEPLPEGLGQLMIQMAQDAEHDPVWRDYCIQFMPDLYERLVTTKHTEGNGETTKFTESTKSEESVQSVDKLSLVRDAMVAALDEQDETLAGTALLGLELLSRKHAEFDRGAIASRAVGIAADETVSVESRMTALRLGANLIGGSKTGNILNHEEHEIHETDSEPTIASSSSSLRGEHTSHIAETARMLAQTGETVLMRSAAIVTLGEVGSERDRELLESFTVSDDSQIVAAAQMALQKLGD